MRKFGPIAVIGMSGRFPLAGSISDLDRIYTENLDGVRPMSGERRKLFGYGDDVRCREMAYLDDIEYFDNDFFNISKHEAALMDPQARIVTEMACGCVEDAGYALSDMRGTRTSVYIGAHGSGYQDWLRTQDGMAVMGNLKDTIAGRVSYLLDLRGDAAVIETACSSSLYAVYNACIQLLAGECDMALAGGITIDVKDHSRDDDQGEGLMAQDGHCKAFDDRADGINSGEGGGVIMLKRLEDAERDNDSILAVIRSAAANQDGGRSNSVAAPSSSAQAELLAETWRKGGISPEDISYFEAHGTGTKLGDPIEIAGITDACRQFTDRKGFCPVGSLKTNFAHMGAAAGIASIIKMIVSFRTGKRYALRDFRKPNSFIDFASAPVYPAAVTDSWPEDRKKIAAISAFGISGTNVHMVLEEYSGGECKGFERDKYMITLSARTEESLDRYCSVLKDCLKDNDIYMDRIEYTLNRCRDDYEFRKCIIAKDREDLIGKLDEKGGAVMSEGVKVILLCSEVSTEAELRAGKRFYDGLRAAGIEIWKLIGGGTGNIMMSHLDGSLPIEDACAKLGSGMRFNRKGFRAYIDGVEKENSVIYIELGNTAGMFFDAQESAERLIKHIPASESGGKIMEAAAYVYEAGGTADWKKCYEGVTVIPAHLPSYQFSRIRNWPASLRKTEYEQEDKAEENTDDTSLREFLKIIWSRELDIEEIDEDEDLFDLGANSLMGMSIINAIEERTGILMDFEAVYDYCTVAELADYLEGCLAEGGAQVREDEIKPAGRSEWMPVSYNQRRLLFILENVSEGWVYNMPNLFALDESVDTEALVKSMEYVAQRHEILHTIYRNEGGEYFQKCLDEYEIPFEYEETSASGMQDLMKVFAKDCRYVFRLKEEVPVRHKIVKAGDGKMYWFINMHHIAADGWSVGLFMKDFIECYDAVRSGGKPEAGELKIQYIDYSVWENDFLSGEAAAQQLGFWKKELEGYSGITRFPVDKERPAVQTFEGNTRKYVIPEDTAAKLREYSRKNSVSLFMLLESVYALNLYISTGETDIGVGVPVANRTQPEVRDLIGFFSNTVVVRNRLDEDSTVADFVSSNGARISKVYSNTQLPFEEVVSKVPFERRQNFAPLFQYSFVLQNYATSGDPLMERGIVQVDSEMSAGAKFDLTYNVIELENELEILAEYNTDLFYGSTIDDLTERYISMLERIDDLASEKIRAIPAAVQENGESGPQDSGSFSFY